jgi:hypothetical protein
MERCGRYDHRGQGTRTVERKRHFYRKHVESYYCCELRALPALKGQSLYYLITMWHHYSM